jgi:hypothetical protein
VLKDSLQNPEQNDHFNSLVPDTPINRRSFIAAALAAGFAVAADPVLGQAIKTPMDGLEGGDIKIGDIPAYCRQERQRQAPRSDGHPGSVRPARVPEGHLPAAGESRIFRGLERSFLSRR